MPSKAAIKVLSHLNEYIEKMRSIGKEPRALYVSKSQLEIVESSQRADLRKMNSNRTSVKAAKFDTYKGYKVVTV